jgi:hypothetical protein
MRRSSAARCQRAARFNIDGDANLLRPACRLQGRLLKNLLADLKNQTEFLREWPKVRRWYFAMHRTIPMQQGFKCGDASGH